MVEEKRLYKAKITFTINLKGENKMQQMFPGFGELSIQPLKHNFASYLKAQNLSESEIEEIIYKLESDERIKSDRAIYYAVTFALETINPITRSSTREDRKREC